MKEKDSNEAAVLSAAQPKRINKRDFVARVSEEYNIPVSFVRDTYDCIWEMMHTLLIDGHEISLSSVGVFSLKVHKGHKARTSNDFDNGGSTVVNDYHVIKFAASDTWRARVRKDMKNKPDDSKLT